MDRNDVIRPAIDVFLAVALRKESVDRNTYTRTQSASLSVALRKESVDRNPTLEGRKKLKCRSLSARRAWIEINLFANPGSTTLSRSPQGERG